MNYITPIHLHVFLKYIVFYGSHDSSDFQLPVPIMPLTSSSYPYMVISCSCPRPSNMIPMGVRLSPTVSNLLVHLFFNPRILNDA
jgi:hypothetical protein